MTPVGMGSEPSGPHEPLLLKPPSNEGRSRFRLWRWLFVLLWSVAVGASLAWNLHLHFQGTVSRARSQAEGALVKDLAVRELIASLGGVYVPADRGVQPNPHLSHLPHRDLETKEGPLLTLVNSSYFMRLLHEHEAQAFSAKVRGHVTSLHPLREENRPDPWEREALMAFRQGAEEVAGVVEESGRKVYRLMRPRFAEAGCLACHRDQGYRVGEVLGGVSVTVPLSDEDSVVERRGVFAISLGHTFLWFLGLGGLALGFRLVERREQALQRWAFYDPLTALPNRTLLRDRLSQALASAERYDRMSAVLFLDLDRFKIINDSLGHAVGDRLLIEVAQRLKATLRSVDTVGRQGGDEFVVLLEELQNDPERAAVIAQSVAEKILRILKEPVQVGNHELHVSPSIGIALFPMGESSAEEILKQADAAMYQAKNKGGDAFHFYLPSMQLAAADRLELENDLRHAVERGELELCFQPQAAVATGQLVGAEALVRWRHPSRGMISPGEFIPVAEETGIILTIGNKVLELACRHLREWGEQGLVKGDFRLAVNVSPKQFRQENFVETVANIIGASGVGADRLELELTEGMFVDDVEDAAFKMACLMELGIRFAIDDFGTGYSSLMYLKRLPLNVLKIDRSFVDGVIDTPNDAAIVETILAMAEKFGYHVVAEGVETEEQLAFLRQRGCHTYQGYLISRPLGATPFRELLRSQYR
ncbi:MAG: hypothetical protein Kow006_01630 [Gammaproteobacteria bacterium]